MKVLINENQYKQIIKESITENILKGIKDSEALVSGLIDNSEGNFQIKINNLVTSNTNIGGLIGPVNDYIIENFDKISEDERKLLLTALIIVLFSNDEQDIYEVLYGIKKDRLTNSFRKAHEKASELLDSFLNYLTYLGIDGNQDEYLFMIPYIPELLNTDIDIVFDNKLASRITLLSGLSIEKSKELIQRIIDTRTTE